MDLFENAAFLYFWQREERQSLSRSTSSCEIFDFVDGKLPCQSQIPTQSTGNGMVMYFVHREDKISKISFCNLLNISHLSRTNDELSGYWFAFLI